MPPFVFIPAYNEGHYIENTLRMLSPLQKNGTIGHILLIDDGSIDATSLIADRACDKLKLDARIIKFRENRGMGTGFYEAIRYFFARCANKPTPHTLITFDADVMSISEEQVRGLEKNLGKVSEQNGLRLATEMSIGIMNDGNPLNRNHALSGERAFVLKSLKAFLIKPALRRKLMLARNAIGPVLNSFYMGDVDVNFTTKLKRRVDLTEVEFFVAPISGSYGREGREEDDLDRIIKEIHDVKAGWQRERDEAHEAKSAYLKRDAKWKADFVRRRREKRAEINAALRGGNLFVRRPRKTIIR